MKQAIQCVNIHEAKTQLSRFVDQASHGEPFIIAKAGKPLVKLIPLEPPAQKEIRRLGFLSGQFSIPDDFDAMGKARSSGCSTGKREISAGHASSALDSVRS